MSIYAKTKMEALPGSCTECKLGKQYGYVGDVKCRILQKYFTGNVEPPYKERPDECPLVEQLEPSNAPLTLEQLREMDGEPVWCVDGRGNACWCLVNVDDGTPHCYDNETGFWDGAFYGMSGDGKHGLYVFGWLAYRRKPEGGEEHGAAQE